MTAYVVSGLVQARDAGTTVTQEAVDKGVKWLQQDLGRGSRTAPGAVCGAGVETGAFRAQAKW